MANQSGSNKGVKTAALVGGGLLASLTSGKVLALVISLHVIAGIGAGYIVVAHIQAKRKMTFTGGPPTTNASQRALEHKVAMGKKRNVMSAPAQAKRITTSGLSKVALPDMPSMPSATEVMPGRMSGMGGFGFGPGGGGGGGLGDGGGGGDVNFFGLRSRIKAVVFVVDVSGSMVENPKNADSWLRLEAEVEKAITGLEPRTRFGLVAFSTGAQAYRDELIDARTDEKKRALAWLKKSSPITEYLNTKDEKLREKHRNTRADLGLEKAFRMKPDTIFFVSDGAPTGGVGREEVEAKVEKAQSEMPRRVVINTVAYIPDSGEAFMRDLAKNSNGEYREIR
jgi:hypothetical protein